MSCEKNTDNYMQRKYEEIFNKEYNTNGNKELFNNLKPDRWDIYENEKIIFIIENKRNIKLKNQGVNQLIKYYNELSDDIILNYKIYLILGIGESQNNFNYFIYKIKKEKILIVNKKLENIKDKMNLKNDFNYKEIHNFNQYLYDNGILLNKKQKTLFVASILLALKVDNNFIKDYDINKPGFLLANKIIELINQGYNDPVFTSQFEFIKKSLKNKYLYDLINKIYIDIKKYGKDILNQFYNEFCKKDKNFDVSNGVVLTPPDIIELMVNELDIKETDEVLDFCTGTGSFLLESSKYSKKLIGCEYDEERYALCKCNFILNDLDYSYLYFNSCFNQLFPKVDKSIINPPFSSNCIDEDVKENTTNWKLYKEAQRFLLYQIQNLKIGGMGACIIPRSNFSISNLILNFKEELTKNIKIKKIINCNGFVFKPIADNECTIIIYERILKTENPNISKNVKIIDYTDDGYKIKDNSRIKYKEPNIKLQIRDLKYDDDWNYEKKIMNIPNINKLKEIEKYKNQIIELQNKINILNNSLFDDNIIDIKIIKCKLSDYCEIITLKNFPIEKSQIGNIPLYSAKKINLPAKYINEYSIDTDNSDDILIQKYGILCINKTGNGGAGFVFIRKGKFALTSSVLSCKLKKYINDINLSYLTLQLHNQYNYANSLNIKKFNKIEINLFDVK